ncbi:MAG: hypothetical protein IJX33_05075 [Akkermansia sp.]|nr:hypothetical protein [Akkermansia sp.]
MAEFIIIAIVSIYIGATGIAVGNFVRFLFLRGNVIRGCGAISIKIPP